MFEYFYTICIVGLLIAVSLNRDRQSGSMKWVLVTALIHVPR